MIGTSRRTVWKRAIVVGVTTASIAVPATVSAQDSGRASWERSAVSYGAGMGFGWGPFATDSGPWVDAFGVIELPLSHTFYLRGEPGITSGWLSDSRVVQLGLDPTMTSERLAQSDEKLHVYGAMARFMLGVDFTDWATFRLGGVGGYLWGSFESTVCPSESYSRPQYGLLAQAAVRLGTSRRVELAVQGESLSDFANPRCRPKWDSSLPLDQRLTGPFLLVTEPSKRPLAFIGTRLSYVWY